MEINVSTSMGFENRNFLHSTAKQILEKSGADEEKAETLIKNTFIPDYEKNTGASIYSASAQITLSNSLKETLKYLNAHAKDKRKQYVLGELWDKLTECNDDEKSELLDFEVNYNLKNIFAA